MQEDNIELFLDDYDDKSKIKYILEHFNKKISSLRIQIFQFIH